jgi:carbonic anhydrase
MKVVTIIAVVQSVAVLAVGGLVVAQRMAPAHAAAAPGVHPDAGEEAHGEAESHARPDAHGKPDVHAGADAHAPAAAVPAHAQAQEDAPADTSEVVRELFEGNERFVQGVARHRDVPAERRALAAGQHPRTIVLACSDSRVPPELVFDQSLGDLFVVRSAGNVADRIALASMEYAAEHLHASVLLVLGHERCGAVTAAASGDTMPTENLRALMDEIAPALRTLVRQADGAELVHLGVEANVKDTAREVVERSPLLGHLVAQKRLQVVRAVYDLDTGRVRQLEDAQQVASTHH